MSATWQDGTSTPRSAATFETLLSMGAVYVSDYATGTGNDEAAGLQLAITAAQSVGRLVFERGAIYVTGTTLVISSTVKVEGQGATIVRTTGLNGRALSVTGADVEITDLNVDGNLSGGNASAFGCIQWTGARGVARRVKATDSARQGFLVTGSSAVLDCYDCEASSHVSGLGSGDGFLAQSGGVLRTWNCRGDFNDRAGFFFLNGSGAGCHLDGTANTNLSTGADIRSATGTCGTFLTSNNKSWGVRVFGSATASNWTFDHLEDDDCGRATGGEYTPLSSATSLELFGASGFHFATVISRRPLGYGVAVTRDTGTSVGADHNTFGNVYVEGANDPAFHISGGTKFTTVDSLTARACTMPISLGEGVPNNDNDHNRFNFVHAIQCLYSVINIDAGSYNTFGRVVATDCVTNTGYTSLIRLTGAGTTVTKNTVHFWESDNPASTPAAYIMKCDASASHNWIAAGFARNYGTGVLSDANGTNRVDFATPP